MIRGVIARDASGRVLGSTVAPTDFNGGTATSASGVLSVVGVASPIAFYNAGLPYDAQGRLCVVANVAVPIDSFAPGGIPMAGGRVAIGNGLPVAEYLLGLPFTSTGRIAGVVAP